MSKSIAFCGLDCSECIAYKATINNDPHELEEIASRWGGQDEEEYSVEDIRCHGCTSDLLNKHCHVCVIRECGKSKGHNNCGECSQFVCENSRKNGVPGMTRTRSKPKKI